MLKVTQIGFDKTAMRLVLTAAAVELTMRKTAKMIAEDAQKDIENAIGGGKGRSNPLNLAKISAFTKSLRTKGGMFNESGLYSRSIETVSSGRGFTVRVNPKARMNPFRYGRVGARGPGGRFQAGATKTKKFLLSRGAQDTGRSSLKRVADLANILENPPATNTGGIGKFRALPKRPLWDKVYKRVSKTAPAKFNRALAAAIAVASKA